ncbi:MAG: adenylosuccinate synthetase [Opitutales bacterium]
MATADFHSHLIADIGISMGDEGKGRVVHEVLEDIKSLTGKSAAAVVKVNGGANAGHTAAGLKLNLLPSGVGDPELPQLLVGCGVVADPRKFLWEARPLEARGIRVLDRLLIDERVQASDLTHRLLDLAWEDYRTNVLGEKSRGSTGRGISPAYSEETGQWQIFHQAFLGEKDAFAEALAQRADRALRTIRHVCRVSEETWSSFFERLTEAENRANAESIAEGIFTVDEFDFTVFMGTEPFSLNLERLTEVYWAAGQALATCIGDVRETTLAALGNGSHVVAEFGQAHWLDKRHGFSPNVTASHTTTPELFLSAGIPTQPVHVIGCCKAYDTKVGTHLFLTRIDPEDHPLGAKLSELEFGTSTGRQRMVGWFDAVEKGDALRHCGFDDFAINKLDALSHSDDWNGDMKICVAYRKPDGGILRRVPRHDVLRHTLEPVYESLPGWSEDLTDAKSFADFPPNAKRYVAHMVSSVLDVAFPQGFEGRELPQVRYVGVGPEPGQVIRDAPPTLRLIEKFAEPSVAVT